MYPFWAFDGPKCILTPVNEGQLSRLVVERNPWWRDPKTWETGDNDLHGVANARFSYRPNPLPDLQIGGLYTLRGPRRVGKTVELKRAISTLIATGVNPRRIIFAACSGRSADELRTLIKNGRDVLTNGQEPRYWFIDEVTGVGTGWPDVVKDLRDNTDFGLDCLVLSGSSAADLQESRKALAGRHGPVGAEANRTLLPMGFRAFCAALGVIIPDLPTVLVEDMLEPRTRPHLDAIVPWLDKLVSLWELYISVGGFPQAVDSQLKTGSVSDAFMTALSDVVTGEALRIRSATGPEIQTLLRALALALTNPVSYRALQREMGTGSHHTPQALVQDLVDAYVCWFCFQNSDGSPRVGASPKVYFIDPLLVRLAHHKAPTTTPPPESSTISEQIIGLTIARQFERRAPGTFEDFADVLYETTPTRQEIDFVGPKFKDFGYEGKYVDMGTKRAAQTLDARFKKGVLLTRAVIDLTGPVLEIPAAFVGYLLDG